MMAREPRPRLMTELPQLRQSFGHAQCLSMRKGMATKEKITRFVTEVAPSKLISSTRLRLPVKPLETIDEDEKDFSAPFGGLFDPEAIQEAASRSARRMLAEHRHNNSKK